MLLNTIADFFKAPAKSLSPPEMPTDKTVWYLFLSEVISDRGFLQKRTTNEEFEGASHSENLETILAELDEANEFVYLDWNTSVEEALSYFEEHLAVKKIDPFSAEEMAGLKNSVEELSERDPNYQETFISELCSHLKSQNKTVLTIDVSADGLFFCVVDILTLDRWHNVILEEFAWILRMEDQRKKRELIKTRRAYPRERDG